MKIALIILLSGLTIIFLLVVCFHCRHIFGYSLKASGYTGKITNLTLPVLISLLVCLYSDKTIGGVLLSAIGIKRKGQAVT